MSKPVSLADVAALPVEASDEDDMSEDETSFDAAVSEFADVVGVPEERFGDLKSALQALIMTCK